MKSEKYVTVGIKRPRTSSLAFVDLDTHDLDLYRTKDGYHVVAKLDHKFDYHFRRLRVAPKWSVKGRVVNPEPSLVYCGCKRKHKEKRKGRIQVYITQSS
jgi:hypothetical protein